MADVPSKPPSGSSTPNPRFTAQAPSAEDVLKEQTYGLVHLSDFRKRRAEAVEGSANATPIASGAATPDGREPAAKPAFKKRKKVAKKGGLSFGDDEEAEGEVSTTTVAAASRSETPAQDGSGSAAPTDGEDVSNSTSVKKRLKPNTGVAYQPKAMTKSALAREAVLKDQLRKEYLQMQEAVKQTDFVIPFTFFNGKSSAGGMCRVKKGDHVWLFLERARKVGADMAVKGDRTKKDWARIGVDDLIIVRGDLILPHHYDFHYFMLNRTTSYNEKTIFAHSSEPTSATPAHLVPSSSASNRSTPVPEPDPADQLSTAATRKAAAAAAIPDSELEGFSDDPSYTKVVDRRWYERNKHIYPASLWEDFDPEKDYSKGARKDAQGNAFFFSGRS